MSEVGVIIALGVLLGMTARLSILRSDYRKYPGYPHGYITHISLGFIAAALGAVAVPALASKEYTAVTFLALAAQQFRDIRNMERETLEKLEEHELVPRGKDYIEGIARVFEARNYLVMAVSFVTSAVIYLSVWYWGLIVGSLGVLFTQKLMSGKQIKDIAQVEEAQVVFEGPFLKIAEIIIMNVGLIKAREKIFQEGLAVKIKPKDDNARMTLHSLGQRQAIIHTAAALIGTKREIGEQEWSPLARKNIDTGEIVLFIVPNEPDIECLIEAVKLTPVLESSKRKPLATHVGKIASD